MLTENGKNWIAENFGVKVDDKYCYSYDAPTFYWFDPDTNTEKTGRGTYEAARNLVVAKLVGKEDVMYVRIGDRKYYYSDLKAGNDGQDVTLDDLDFIDKNDGYPAGESQYCFTPAAPPPEEEKGYLTVTGTEDADIFLDGVHIGKVPLIKYELEPGEYNIRVTKVGYKEYRDTIKIRGGEETIVNATLEEKPVPEGLGRVCIVSDPPFAWIIIDGKHTWKQTNAPDEPPECFDLTPTDHTIRLEKEGYKPYETRITVRSGQTGKTEDDGLIIAKLEPLPEKERKIEVRVVEKGLSGDVLLDYSWIPSEVIRGATTRFRFYVTNDGGVPAKYQVCIEFEHAETGTKLEPFCSAPIEESPVINPGTGQSYIVPVVIPRTAPLGTYYIYVELWAEKVE